MGPTAMSAFQSTFARSAPEAKALCSATCSVGRARAWYSLLQREPYTSAKTEGKSSAGAPCVLRQAVRLVSRAFAMLELIRATELTKPGLGLPPHETRSGIKPYLVTRHLPKLSTLHRSQCIVCPTGPVARREQQLESQHSGSDLYMAGLVLAGASYVRPVTPFCRPHSMRSLGSCCKLFRQAALVNRTNSAGFDATSRRAFALPRAALSRRSKEASRNVDTDGDGAADNKVLNLQAVYPLLIVSKANFSQLTFVSLQAKVLEATLKDLNSRFGRGTIMQLGNAEPQKL